MTTQRETANAEALNRLNTSEPIVEDVVPAIDVLPGLTPNTILASGATMLWKEYVGGQRDGIIGGVLYEGLASDRDEAIAKLDSGEITVAGAHDYSAVGSLAGIYSPSMPVFVVRNKTYGNIGYCNFYEGTNPRRLNYGAYDEGVKERLDYVHAVVAPVVRDAIRNSGGISLKKTMVRALHMGDELHSRNTAASLLFTRELFPELLKISATQREPVEKTVEALTADNYFFLRLSMAAGKCIADAAHGVEGSSVVSAMALSCREYSIRVSGLDNQWFGGALPTVEAKLFEGHTEDEITWMGGDSAIAETVGLGGFAQAAAFPLQAYQGGSAEIMAQRNLELYDITVGENSDFKIPYFNYRGSPTGIDIFKVIETGIEPKLDMGVAGRNGEQIGAGMVKAPMLCFERAVASYKEKYGD